MEEIFAKPAVAAIIEKEENGTKFILIQERQKYNGGIENGMLEIPAGKIREYESIYDTLRREVREETGLTLTHISGEENTIIRDINGYKTVSFTPFCSTQNLSGGYSIIVQTFICHASGELLEESNETRNLRYVTLNECKQILNKNEATFYPMHLNALYLYLSINS
jgi:8-oxo-dGTP pyrophosphatase MutT (NUDIX family)